MKDFSKNLAWQLSHPEIELSCNLDYDPASLWFLPALSEQARQLPFYVQEVGRTIAGKDYYVGRKNLDSFQICSTLSGGIALNYDGQHIEAKKNSVVWLDCRKHHTFRTPVDEQGVDCYFVHFWGEGAKAYYELFKALAPSGCVQMRSTDRLNRYLKLLLSLYGTDTRTPITDITASTYLSTICLELLESLHASAAETLPEYIFLVKNYLETHYAEKITLEDLAQKQFVSQSYLQKQFKHYYGCSPNEYLLSIRLTQAKLLLRNTSKSINDIAYAVGFNTPSYFISIFGKKEGTTPLAYRKMWSAVL